MAIKLGIYGDSISTGWRGISAINNRWTSIACANLGLEEHNYSVNGMGFLRKRDTDAFAKHPLDMVVDVDPQIALIALGANDFRFIPDREHEVRKWMLHDMRKLRAELPNAQVLVIEPYFPALEEGPRSHQVFELQLACVAEVGLPLIKGQRGVFGNDYEPCLYPEKTQMIHPNDRGHARLGEVMTEALRPYAEAARGAVGS